MDISYIKFEKQIRQKKIEVTEEDKKTKYH